MKTLILYLRTLWLSVYISFQASTPIMLLRLLVLLVSSFIPVINMIAIKNIVNGLVLLNEEEVIHYFVLLAVMQLLSAIVSKITEYFSAIHNDKISLIISKDMINNINRLDISFFDNPKLYDEMVNVSRDINSIPSLIWSVLSSIQVMIQFVISFAIIAHFGWWVSLLICLTCLPSFVVDKCNAMQMYNWNRNTVNDVRKVNYSYDVLTAKYFSKDIRIKALTNYLKNKYFDKWTLWYKAKRKIVTKHFVTSFALMFLPHIVTLLGAWFLIHNIINNKNTIGDFSYYLGMMNQLVTCTFALVATVSQIIQQKAKIEHYNNFKEWKPEIELASTGIEATSFESLEFSHVSFKYPNTEKVILDDISFTINKGEKIGLVGKNGCGKSTIIKLILCLYKPTSGYILLNGKNIFDYDLDSYHKLISEMLQDYINYSFTLKENIYTSDTAKMCTDEEIIRACRMSDSYSFVSTWENGIHSYLTKSFDINGMELSGGQWQKLALARFFYKDAQLYIMDEPSASIDLESEAKIFDNVLHSLTDSTIILISHRLSNIKIMDKIIVLDDGKIAEIGNHDELLHNDGIYAHLYNIQVGYTK